MPRTTQHFTPFHALFAVHGDQELLIVLRSFHALLQKLHSLHTGHVRQEVAQNPEPVDLVLVQEQVIAAGAAERDVHSGEDALVGQLAVQLKLHVAGTLELLEDNVVHLACWPACGPAEAPCCRYP